jgi:hypothetical protein
VNVIAEPMESLVDQVEEALMEIKAMPATTLEERIARADYLADAISAWRDAETAPA